MSDTVPCPHCKGARTCRMHVQVVREGRRVDEWRQIPCGRCKSTGRVPAGSVNPHPLGPDAMMDRPEKRALVAEIDGAIRFNAWLVGLRERAVAGTIDEAALSGLLRTIARRLWHDAEACFHGTPHTVELTAAMRDELKAIAARVVASRGGHFDMDGERWVSADGTRLSKTLIP